MDPPEGRRRERQDGSGDSTENNTKNPTAMKNIFKHLSPEEERHLIEHEGLQRFATDAVIIHEGDAHNAIYVIVAGSVRVEKESAGFQLELSRLGPGEIFGEMSFVEGIEASASVVAEVPVEVYRIDGDYINSLLMTNPSLFGRFYKSLVEIVSHRLRETSMLAVTPQWEPRNAPGLDVANEAI